MTLEELNSIIENEMGVLLYFLGENCNVCQALRPKFKELFSSEFPKIKQIYIDAQQNSEISAYFQVFSIPTIIVFLGGKEFLREGRTVSLHQLSQQLQRPYNLLVDN